MRWLVTGATALLAAGLFASSASAQATRVVMTSLEGRNASAAERVLVSGLEERGITVTRSDATPTSDAEAAAVAGDGQAVIGGTAASRGGRWRVALWVRDASGGMQGEVQRRVQGGRGVRRVVAELADVLAGVPTSGSSTAPEASEAPAAEAPEAADEPAASEDSGAGASSDDSADEEPESSEPVERTRADRSAPDSGDADALPIHATVLLGAGVRTRALELLAPDGIDAGYRAEPYFEIAVRAQARFFDVLFVRATFGSSIGLDSEREDPRLGNVDTWFMRLMGDVGASYVIGETVELGLAFGGVWDRYQLTFNELVPTAEYASLRPAFVSGFRLVGTYLVLDAEVGVRIPLSVGDLEALHGTDRRAIGLDGVARLGGVIEPGFTWSLEVGARHYWLRFRRSPGQWVNGFDAGWHATGYAGWTF